MYNLRVQFANEPETLNTLALAAEERLQEAAELLAQKRSLAAIYLAGYSVEMWLKYAYFRVTGAALDDDVSSRLEPARTRGRHLIPEIDCEHFHNPLFWFRLLAVVRATSATPMSPLAELQFMSRVLDIHENWWVALRYKPDTVPILKAEDICNSAEWINRFRENLWR